MSSTYWELTVYIQISGSMSGVYAMFSDVYDYCRHGKKKEKKTAGNNHICVSSKVGNITFSKSSL